MVCVWGRTLCELVLERFETTQSHTKYFHLRFFTNTYCIRQWGRTSRAVTIVARARRAGYSCTLSCATACT